MPPHWVRVSGDASCTLKENLDAVGGRGESRARSCHWSSIGNEGHTRPRSFINTASGARRNSWAKNWVLLSALALVGILCKFASMMRTCLGSFSKSHSFP